jgi:hypothetical protein
MLLELASNRLRLIGEDLGIDVDGRADSSEAYASTIKWVVLEAVKRAMTAPVDQQAIDSYAQTAGPYSENYKYSNPSGDLWFKKTELTQLGLYGKQTMSGITTSQNLYGDIYSS